MDQSIRSYEKFHELRHRKVPVTVTETPRQSLLNVLLANPTTALRSAAIVAASQSWNRVFELAEVWSVVPQLAERIRSLGIAPSAEDWRRFRRLSIETFTRSATRASKASSVLQHLWDHEIPAMAFKGIASMARLYALPANRTIKDADILIEPKRLNDAIAVLGGLGFVSVEKHEPERLDRFLDHSPGFSGNKAIVLSDPSGLEIDLHWSVGLPGLSFETLLGRSERIPLFGALMRIVGPGDALALTARHAIRENLAVDMICRDLLDIRLGCAWLSGRGSLASGLRTAAEGEGYVPLIALTRVLKTLDPADEAVGAANAFLSSQAGRSQRRAAEDLTRLFFLQIVGGPVRKDILYLSHTGPIRQILAGAMENWSEYRSFMRSMEVKLEGRPVPLRGRLWELAKAINRLRPRDVRSLHTLGRLKYGSAGKPSLMSARGRADGRHDL